MLFYYNSKSSDEVQFVIQHSNNSSFPSAECTKSKIFLYHHLTLTSNHVLSKIFVQNRSKRCNDEPLYAAKGSCQEHRGINWRVSYIKIQRNSSVRFFSFFHKTFDSTSNHIWFAPDLFSPPLYPTFPNTTLGTL